MKREVLNKVKDNSKKVINKMNNNRKYLVQDIRSNWKYILFILSLIGFESLIYSLSKITPFERIILSSSFDDKLPLITQFVYIYSSWYLLLFLVPYFLFHDDKIDNFYEYCITYIVMVILSCIVFFLFPTEIIRPEIVTTNISSYILKFIYFVDTPAINCLPSMHCAVCFAFIYFSIKMGKKNKISKYVYIILSILIIISTMLVKQHLIYDVIAALILFVISITIVKVFKLGKRIQTKFEKNI